MSRTTAAETGAVLRALDAAAVLGRAQGWLRNWVVFGLGTGLRPGEQGALRWSDVRLAEGAVRVRGTKTRGSVRVVVPVAGDALTVLRRLAGGRGGRRPRVRAGHPTQEFDAAGVPGSAEKSGAFRGRRCRILYAPALRTS